MTSAGSGSEFDVLCVGLVCVDLTLGVAALPLPDDKLRARQRLLAPGGPAAVAAAQVARLGGRVAFSGRVGEERTDPLAGVALAAFAAEGIDVSSCVRDASFRTPLAAVLVADDGRRVVVSHRDDAVGPAPCWPAARVILADGHRPEWNDALIAHARACGAKLVLDAGSVHAGTLGLAPHVDHLVASEAYARAMAPGLDPAADEFDWAALGGRRSADWVVTLGERGVVWRGPEGQGRVAAFDVEVVDTNGAGDAFHGAYAWVLARDFGRAERLRYASAAGALACSRAGAWPAMATRREIETLLATQG